MGIYIPGMKMPKSCFECNLKKIWDDGVQCLVNKGLWMDCDSKHKACPLVPVPEFSDIGSDSDDVWKKIFALVVLLLSDREKFDKLKDDILADMEE